ncbi:MAG: alpha/beta hydrolase [Acidimicrobiales bacterium]|nr:MAG: alpha/beta hydrolase [Acidimicrobiales bacterium]
MSKSKIHAVEVKGSGGQTLVLLHGYGCDKNMWGPLIPLLQSDFRIVVYDLMGWGQSDFSRYDKERYSRLDGHAQDLVDILSELEIEKPVLVGHSVSAMTVALFANMLGDKIGDVIMICPSPSFINDGDYIGGFDRSDILALLETLDANYLGWSSEMAPAIMGTPDRPEHGETLTNSFCQADPEIAQHFARVTFLSDHRGDMKKLTHNTLMLQCRDDVIVPTAVGTWLDDTVKNGELVMLDATGHCPHISFPKETAAAIRQFLDVA